MLSAKTAEILTFADESLDALSKLANAQETWKTILASNNPNDVQVKENLESRSVEIQAIYEEYASKFKTLTAAANELELLANESTVHACNKFAESIWYIRHGLRAGGSEEKWRVYSERLPGARDARKVFIREIRYEIGLQKRRRWLHPARTVKEIVRKVKVVWRKSNYDHM